MIPLAVSTVGTWVRGHWRVVVIALVVLAGLLLAFCHPTPNSIPPKEQTSIDSLKITKPGFDSTQHVVKQQAAKVVTKIVHDSAAAVRARAEADHYRRIADSALAVARAQHDTTSAAFVAATNATKEADQLRATNDTLTVRLSEAKTTIVALTDQIARDSLRQHASDDLNARLAKDVKTAGQCRMLPFIRCPTRKQAFVLGAGTAIIAKYAYDQRRGKP